MLPKAPEAAKPLQGPSVREQLNAAAALGPGDGNFKAIF